MVGSLRQVAVSVANLETSRDFYRDVVGLTLLFEAPPGLAFFDLGNNIWLMLSRANEKEPAAAGSVLYFSVGDIHAAHEELKGRGADFVDEPHVVANLGKVTIWMSFFRDPDGTLLALHAEVPN